MKTVTIIYTDNTKGMFDCKSIRYDVRAAVFCTTDDEIITIPYYNVYFIKECEKEVTAWDIAELREDFVRLLQNTAIVVLQYVERWQNETCNRHI